jgi:hypothetical protein
MKKIKAFLNLEKARDWFLKNKPEDVLLAKLDDGTLPVKVIDDGVEQNVYLSFNEGDDVIFELEVEIIDDLRFKATIDEDIHTDLDISKHKKYERIFTQPEKDAWIIWREVDEDGD